MAELAYNKVELNFQAMNVPAIGSSNWQEVEVNLVKVSKFSIKNKSAANSIYLVKKQGSKAIDVEIPIGDTFIMAAETGLLIDDKLYVHSNGASTDSPFLVIIMEATDINIL